MLFGLNTVSVLTLIDVAVCLPFLLQTEITHRSGYYRLGGVRQKQPFLRHFEHHSLLPCFVFPGSEKAMSGNRVTRKRKEGAREKISRLTAEKREGLHKGRSYNQFNHTIGNVHAHRLQHGLSLCCTGMFIRMSNK